MLCKHIIENDVIKSCQFKIKTILNWSISTNVHEIRQFLNLVTYYRRFVKKFAKIFAFLFKLLKESDVVPRKKKFKFIIWIVTCQHVFEILKKVLISESILIQSQSNKWYVIETNVSKWAIKYNVLQKKKNDKMHLVTYDDKKLFATKLNYSVHKKELLAIKHLFRSWFYYIDNQHKTEILIGYQSLKYLKTMKNLFKRLIKWIFEFLEYNLKIKYCKEFEVVVLDVIFKRSDLMEKNFANKNFSFNAMIKEIDEQKSYTAMIEYIQKNIEFKKKLKKHILDDRQNFRFNKKNSNKSTLYKILSNNMKEISYFEKLFCWNFLNKYHSNYKHLKFSKLLNVIKIKNWWHL